MRLTVRTKVCCVGAASPAQAERELALPLGCRADLAAAKISHSTALFRTPSLKDASSLYVNNSTIGEICQCSSLSVPPSLLLDKSQPMYGWLLLFTFLTLSPHLHGIPSQAHTCRRFPYRQHGRRGRKPHFQRHSSHPWHFRSSRHVLQIAY